MLSISRSGGGVKALLAAHPHADALGADAVQLFGYHPSAVPPQPQQQMAKILHVSRTAVSNYERGRMEPSIQTLKDIAQFFGISLDWLLR